MAIPVLLDCGPGHDHALAILTAIAALAEAYQERELAALCT
jgi:inosine-uridine nucleoside N-ribohydrolase